MIQAEQQIVTEKLEGLNEWTIGWIVIYGIHLYNPGIRICVHVFVVFLTGPAFRIGKVFARLKLPLFGGGSSHLLLQIKTVDGNTGFCKYTGFDIGINGFFAQADLRMGCQDSVNGLSFIKQGLNQFTEFPNRAYRGVNTSP